MSFSARTLQDAAGGAGGLGAYLVPNGIYYSFALGGGTATTTWSAKNNGEIEILGISIENYTWLTGGGTNADYEIRWTHHLNNANYWRNRHLDKHVCW
jgi:hypothetical protein